MFPVLFRYGPITLYSYGLMMALAFIGAGIIIYLELRRRGFDTDLVYDLMILAAIGGILGARIFYVIGHWSDYNNDLWQLFAIRSGGLIFYGGVFGGAITILVFIWRKSLDVRQIADISAPALAVGAAIGRIGCLLQGCCYGKITNMPWGIEFFDLIRHPTQIYELFMNLMIFAILWIARTKTKRDGQLFILYLFLYSVARFIVEFFRVTIPVFYGLSASQLISILIFIVSGFVLIKNSLLANETD